LEVESAAALASTREQAKDYVRRIALIEGELEEAKGFARRIPGACLTQWLTLRES
jgi:hypothetical protein